MSLLKAGLVFSSMEDAELELETLSSDISVLLFVCLQGQEFSQNHKLPQTIQMSEIYNLHTVFYFWLTISQKNIKSKLHYFKDLIIDLILAREMAVNGLCKIGKGREHTFVKC